VSGPAPGAVTAAMTTAPARGGIAVIVLAGDAAGEVLGKIFRPRGLPAEAGRLGLGWIVRGAERVDEAVASVGADGRLAEINIHGGPHVARRVLALLGECGATIAAAGAADAALERAARAAAPDRAGIAGEMLAALSRASTPLAAAAVTAQWAGGLAALAEADRPRPADLRAAAAALPRMARLLEPAEVVIAGAPNVGKSALANALAGRNVSIVSETAGTTRDWVRCAAEAEGVPVRLTDTAGLWRTDGVDAEAVDRAWRRIERADLVLCVTSPDAGGHNDLAARLHALPRVLRVWGKCDLGAPATDVDAAVSARTGEGLAGLRRAIRDRLGFAGFDPAAPMAFTDRQAGLLAAAAEAAEAGDPSGARDCLDRLLHESGNGP